MLTRFNRIDFTALESALMSRAGSMITTMIIMTTTQTRGASG